MLTPTGNKLMAVYDRLYARFGPQYWWPGETPFEVCVGAILTQNTAWTQVEKAISNLKAVDALSPVAMVELPQDKLARLIRPSGYFNLKTQRLHGFLGFLMEDYRGDLSALLQTPLAQLRPQLLKVYGIGPETADSMLLYAGGHPSFVVDAYTLRIFSRLRLVDAGADYHQVQRLFQDHLPRDTRLFNEYHALIVALGKDHCRPQKPRCDGCPVAGDCAWQGDTI